VLLVSHRTSSGSRNFEGGQFTLESGKKQGFDIRGEGWMIEIRSGDASKLFVYDFSTSGGGKGNKLGMCTNGTR